MQKQFVLKARETVKRVAAITAGATLLGATAMGAVAAADLGDYPAPFVADGSLVGLVVVGSDAAAGDIVGAGDIISTLTQAAVTTVAGTGTTTVTGGLAKEILIGTGLNSSNAFSGVGVNDEDVATLLDQEINIDVGSDKNYDIHEAIWFNSGASIETGTTSAAPSENFGTDTFLELDKNSIRYQYIFDDLLDTNNFLVNATSDSPISVVLLGHDLEITGATATSLTVNLATKYFLAVGESVTVGGKTVTLKEVGSLSVVVDVGGITEVVDSNTKTVNGIKVRGESYFSKDAVGAGSATISIGEDISKTYKHGDEFIGEDDTDPNWVWELSELNSSKPNINVSWDQIVNDADDDWLISVENDESITLPNNYATVSLNTYTQEDRQEYRITMETGEELMGSGNVTDNTNAKVMHWEAVGASGDDAFTVNSQKTDDVWVSLDGSNTRLHYYNTTSNKISFIGLATNSTTAFTLDYKDTALNVNLNFTGDGTWNFTLDEKGNHNDVIINMENDTSGDFGYLGETEGDSIVTTDIRYNNTDISGWKEDTRTERGLILKSYYDTDSADEFSFSIPGDITDYDVEVIVSGTGSTVSTTGGTTVVNSVAGVSVIKLDSEITDPASKNLILVGGPAVNSLTAQALGLSYPTTGAASTIPENAATLRMVSNAFGGSNSALVVAGWGADDTRNAASVLQDYSSHASALAGNSEVEVRGSTVTAVGGDVTTA